MGFEYTGLQDGLRCICMNERPQDKTTDDKCNISCPGDRAFSCGGDWTMAVHQIPIPPTTYLGCFNNSLNDFDRMIFEGTYNNFRNNTPEW